MVAFLAAAAADPAFSARYGTPAELAEGGQGAVYGAVDRALPGRCVLKTLRDQVRSPTTCLLFEAEIAITTRLSEHPHFAQVLAAGDVGGHRFLALRYYGGGTLAARIEAGLELPRLVELLLPVLGALDYAHRAGIIHGDVCATQILLDDDGAVPVLADLGAARILPGIPAVTVMPPPGVGDEVTHYVDGRVVALLEQVERDVHRRLMVVKYSHVAVERIERRVPDPVWDLHAIAVIGFRALTGAYPYQVAGLASGDFRGWASARVPTVDDGLRWAGRQSRRRYLHLEHVIDQIFARRLTTARMVAAAFAAALDETRWEERHQAHAAARRRWLEAELARTPRVHWLRRRELAHALGV